MRLRSIELWWFRGAADRVSLELDGRSMVLYGANGSGKSSFVDAVEYVLKDGKIGHLAHEYSGKRQERAIPNTHTPQGQKTALRITFQDGSKLTTEIRRDGTSVTSGEVPAGVKAWDYLRTVLRQGEVADFIMGTKGDKYSALLPLLGLDPMETAAENLRQIGRSAEEVSNVRGARGELESARLMRKATFGDRTDTDIFAAIEQLYAEYCAEGTADHDALTCCSTLADVLDARIAASSAAERRHVALNDISTLDLPGCIDTLRDASSRLADSVEPYAAEKLGVLESADAFAARLGDQDEVQCPACGRFIQVVVFQQHLREESARLRRSIDAFRARKTAIANLCDAVRSVKANLGKTDLKEWREEVAEALPTADVAYLDRLDTEALRGSCGEGDLRALEEKVCPLCEAAGVASAGAPPSAQRLSTDKHTVEVGAGVFAAIDRGAAVQRAETLVSFIRSVERGVREELKLRSQSLVEEISDDVQDMWAVLHPDEEIEKVRLHVPDDADKAIDIALSFHGVEQDSPRLTLSEGHRNSLGLCIFLAMAKRESKKDGPVFLDDVVISVDRNHRGMIVDLLKKHFSGRQVVILTHDRDWYSELRHQLDGSEWQFRALLPYETPSMGIRWSHIASAFGDARAQLRERPDSAGNDARKIMDVELALVAEHLRMRMPYLRAEKNDRRIAHDFIQRLVSDGKSCFQKRDGDGYVICTAEIGLLQEADGLLASWGNRGSHSFDLVRPEASKLIDACEKALECFACKSCGKRVWYANAGGPESVQCECGQIRWRYGKG